MGVKFCIYILLDDYHKCKLKQTDLSIVEKNEKRCKNKQPRRDEMMHRQLVNNNSRRITYMLLPQ
jgi:hypothetical protein